MKNPVQNNFAKITQACERFQVSALYVFGSVLTERFTPESDVDFLVEFEPLEPLEYGENYFEFKFELEKILKRKVDLLEAKAMRNQALKKALDKSKVQLYARRNQGVA